jgi:uncharacterized membrane protein YbhN (UPF0104 family)
VTSILAALNHPALRLLGPLAGLGCAGLFMAGLDLSAVGAAFGRVDWWWLAPMLLLGCINLWLRAARWGVLLAPVAPLPISQLLGIGITAAVAGLGLPARGGDAVKVLLATRLPGVRLADIAAAELLERVVDGAIFGAFIAGAAMLSGVEGWPLALGLGAVALYVPVLAAVPIAGWYLGAPVDRAGEPSRGRWHPRRLIGWAAEAAHRRGPSLLVHAARLSLLAWAAEAASYYCLLVAFGWIAPPTLPFAAVGVANFAFAVPGAPAGVGTFHMPVSSLLVDGFGAEPGLAAAFAVVLHLAVLAPVPLVWLLLAARARWQAVPVRVR